MAGIGRIDYAEHGFRLHEVDSPGKKGTQRKLAGHRRSHAPGEKIGQDCFEQRRRARRMDFDNRLAGVAAAGGPTIKQNGNGHLEGRQAQHSGVGRGQACRFPTPVVRRTKYVINQRHRPGPAHANDAAARPAGRGRRYSPIVSSSWNCIRVY